MWINPKYRDQVEQPRPPAETGRRIATFARGDSAEMRVVLSEFQGKPFLSLRVWERDPSSSDWWPCKGKGCSIRMNEAGELAEALVAVAPGQGATMVRHTGPLPRDEAPKFVDKGRRVRPPWDAGKLAGAEPGQGFDEFNDA